MKKFNLEFSIVLYIILAVFLITGCAHVSAHEKECITNDPYGFWGGIWHGLILPFSFIGSLFNDNITIYAYNNNGNLYDIGFIIGLGGLYFGGSSSSK